MPHMSRATLDGLGLAGFGMDFNTLGKRDDNESEFRKYYAVAEGFSDQKRMIPGYESIPLESVRKWKAAVDEYVEFLRSVIRTSTCSVSSSGSATAPLAASNSTSTSRPLVRIA